MKTAWTRIYKPEAIRELDNAGITNPEFRLLYIRFKRRINTLWTKLGNGTSWDSIHYTDAYNEASDLLERFNNGGYGLRDEAEFWNDWKLLCEANGKAKEATLGDHLC